MKYITLTLLLTACGSAQTNSNGSSNEYIPTFPVPIVENIRDTTQISKGNLFQTRETLNDSLRVTSFLCQVNGEFIRDRDECYELHATVWDKAPTQVYRVNIGKVKLGEVYEVLNQTEFTNDLSHIVMVATGVNISTNPNDTTAYKDFHNVIHSNGTNLTHEVHHLVDTKVGAFVITQEMVDEFGNDDAWVIVLAVSAVSLSVLESGDEIKIERTSGQLSVLKQ